MNRFTIKDIENLSGIKAHTWRVWEQRYGIDTAQRKDSNHRFYGYENLKGILRIAYLYHCGTKISKIAKLGSDEIKRLALEKRPIENENEFYIKELVEASVDLDEERFEYTLSEVIGRIGMADAILKVLYLYQKKIGVLWLTDHIIPAQEHFTSNIVMRKLAVAIDTLPDATRTDKGILLFTPPHELHELPLKFIYYLLKKNGKKVIYLGSNVPLAVLKTTGENFSFSHIYFHLVTNLTGNTADNYLLQLGSTFADKTIVMSGTEVLRVTDVPENVRLLKSMDEIVAFTNE